MKTRIEVDKEEVRDLLGEVNTKLFLLEGEEDSMKRQVILDYLLESKESPIKSLARILEVLA